MDQEKQTCENCGNFLQYYAFVGGIYFRPVSYGQCRLKSAHKGFNEMRECGCGNWTSNEELLKKRNRLTECMLYDVSRKFYDFLMFLIAKES